MFEKLTALPKDAILKVITEYERDTRAEKIDLGVGVYRDTLGNTPILGSVKKAEQHLIDTQTTKAYLGSSGADLFNRAIQLLIFGEEALRLCLCARSHKAARSCDRRQLNKLPSGYFTQWILL